MEQQQKKYPNSARSFKNDRKDSEKHPDFEGEGEVDCPHCGKSFGYWLKTWIKDGARGPWWSHAFKIKTKGVGTQPSQGIPQGMGQSSQTSTSPVQTGPQTGPKSRLGALNDEIPF